MKIVSVLTAITVALFLSGCGFQIQMMPRDNGKVYHGEGSGAFGHGTFTVDIDGEKYTGPAVSTGPESSFGFFQTYGKGGSSFGATQSFSSRTYVKVLLSSPANHGLRCDMFFDGFGHGAGICLDDKGMVYDIVAGY